MLLLQDEVERNEAQRRLGLSAQTFCLHNPTGFYNLNLTYTLNPQPSTLDPQPSTLNPQPSTLQPDR